MKIVKFLFAPVLLASSLIWASSCDDEPELPPITMEGKNTFGCLVNGKVWLPTNQIWADMTVSNFLGISASIFRNSGIRLIIDDETGIKRNTEYVISQDSLVNFRYYKILSDGTCHFNYEHLITGRLLITKLESTIISGTFEFTSFNPDCGGTVTVTQGRFDIGNILR